MTHADFERLFRSVYPDLHRYFVRRLGGADAEDAVADTLAAVYRRWSDAPGDLDQQRAWTFGFAQFKIKEMERSRLRDVKVAHASALNYDPTGQPSHDEGVAALDRARYLLAQLPEAERDAVYLVAVVGMTSAEAGAALNCSVSAITSRVSRGRARLRELVNQGMDSDE